MKHQEGARVNAGYPTTRCEPCGNGKWVYVSRKAARRARRLMTGGATKGAELSAYQCPHGNGWHLGHLHDHEHGRDRLRASRDPAG